MVFTLPSVEVGSILEYRLQIRYDDDMVSSPTWEIQQPYFVHKAHYCVRTHQGTSGTSRTRVAIWPQLDVCLGRGQWCQDAARYEQPLQPRRERRSAHSERRLDAPAEYASNGAPSSTTAAYMSGGEFWQKEGKRWAKDTDRFANPSKTLKDAVAKIVNPGDTDEQKARKLYEEVMKLDNTDFTRREVQRRTQKRKTEGKSAMPKMCGRKRAALPTILRFSMSPWRAPRDCTYIPCRSSTATGQSSIQATSRSASSMTTSR